MHRNVFMSCGLGSLCPERGCASRWLSQSKGQNMKGLYKKNLCCFLISVLGSQFSMVFAAASRQLSNHSYIALV